jgi:hypothetical protein
LGVKIGLNIIIFVIRFLKQKQDTACLQVWNVMQEMVTRWDFDTNRGCIIFMRDDTWYKFMQKICQSRVEKPSTIVPEINIFH